MTLNRRTLDELSSETVVKLCEQNYIDNWRCVGCSPNAEFSEDRGITQCITGIPQEMFNVVLKCNLHPGTIDARIDEAIRHFRSRRITMIWHTGILTEPKDIGRYLEARGFPHDYDLAAMAVDLDTMDQSLGNSRDVSTRVVTTESDVREWVKSLASSWESPKEIVPWMMHNACFNPSIESKLDQPLPRRMFLGLYKGRPVGCAMLVWSDQVAGLQAVGTVGANRSRGVGTALVQAALTSARAAGFKFVVVLSTVEGVRLYKKCGFRVFGKLPEYSMDFRLPRQ